MGSALSTLATAFVGLVALLFAHEFWRERQYRLLAEKYRVALPLTVLDRPFGIPSIFKLRQYFARNRLLEFFRDEMYKYNIRTVRYQTTLDMNIATVDPENIKTILATNFKDYSLGIRYKQFRPLLGNGIFTLSGEGWKHSRAMLRPQFSREQISHLDSLRSHMQKLMDVFKARSEGGNYFDCQALFHDLTMDTATEFLFGESLGSLSNSSRRVQGPKFQVSGREFAESFSYCLDWLALRAHVGNFYPLADSFEFRRRIQVCHEFVDYFVGKALAHPLSQTDVTKGPYVFIRELTRETRDPKVIRDQAFNVLLAGRDSTASLLSFIIYYLARHKTVWHKLRQAVLDEFDNSTDTLSFETFKRCVYLTYVINEVLRLHPIVPLNFRTAVRDTILPRGGGPNGDEPIVVPKGTKVVYVVYATQRLKEYWGEDAEDFRPERWAEPTLHTWDYLPFNGGPRICIGQQVALTEVSFCIVRICQTFRDLSTSDPTDYHDIGQWSKLTASVAGGVPVNFVPA